MKTEAELKSEFEKYAGKETGGAWIIVAALVFEAALLWRYSGGKSSLETALFIISDLGIAAGVYLEIHFGRRAKAVAAELQAISDAKLAEAFDRAAKAERDLIEFRRTRRSLIQPNMESLVAELKPFARTKYDIGFGPGDGEQANFCWDVETMLANAGWDEQQWGVIASGAILVNDRGPTRPRAGLVSAESVEIHLDSEWRRALLPAATALISALKGIGIEANEVPFNTTNGNAHAIHILIGPKA
jgi:hypothetical protein